MMGAWLRGGRNGTPSRAAALQPPAELLATVSHDLLTPITRMKLRAELISAYTVRQKFMADLDEVDGLVRSILAYAASAHGRADECVDVEIASFLSCVAFDYQDSSEDVVLSDTFMAVVPTRPQSLRRILTNLVDNALKYTGAAEIAMVINEGASLSIRVLDRGPGLPEEHLRAAIRPFVRLGSGSNVKEGLGLGLATASNLAHALSGSLSLSNREGGGLKAELRLPGYRQPC